MIQLSNNNNNNKLRNYHPLIIFKDIFFHGSRNPKNKTKINIGYLILFLVFLVILITLNIEEDFFIFTWIFHCSKVKTNQIHSSYIWMNEGYQQTKKRNKTKQNKKKIVAIVLIHFTHHNHHNHHHYYQSIIMEKFNDSCQNLFFFKK